jgi:tRNA dimethylallyltransferase
VSALGGAGRRHLVLVGPTASGKSSVAMALARRRIAAGEPVELISMDSMAVYRGMDVGTTTPPAADRVEVPHHLLDVIEPDQEYSVAEFAVAVRGALADIETRGARAILVGGTGLYVQAVVDGLHPPGQFPQVREQLERELDTHLLYERLRQLDADAAARIEPDNRRRVVRALEVSIGAGRPFSSFGPGLDSYPDTPFVLAGLRVDRELLGERIRERVDEQLRDGFLGEVRALMSRPEGMSRTASQALGYGEMAAHLRGECTLSEAVDTTARRTRQFAVRQIRWFRRDPRVVWFDHDGDPAAVLDGVERLWREREGATAATAPVGRSAETRPGHPRESH